VLNDDGEPVRLVGTAQDITDAGKRNRRRKVTRPVWKLYPAGCSRSRKLRAVIWRANFTMKSPVAHWSPPAAET